MVLWKRLIIKVFYVSLKVAERKYQKKKKIKTKIYAGVHLQELFSLMAGEFPKMDFIICIFLLKFEKQGYLIEKKIS